MSYIIMIIAAIFVNNIVLAQFLGICPFLGVSKKVDTAAGMGMAVAFVMLLATLVTWPVYYFVLVPYGLQFMQTIVYILVIAALVQMVEIILKKSMPSLYSALGVFLPLITTNCTILGVAINVINFEYTLLESAVYAVATALGFSLAMVLFAGIREQIAVTDVPKGMKGTPIALLIAGLLALAFMGFSGIDNTLKVMFNIG
ncbi:MAG: electron transport complex subunit RsxA [Bacteroidales bacterium]|nr:electron transport complex subunit RsxA [Bacteroidales bacterium]MBR3541830.1 electron transport complex subunit RsxA [Bacteroidales bacterium]